MLNHRLYYGDNLAILQEYIPDESVNLIYIDPPFNTGKHQQRTEIEVKRDTQGDRIGFQGKAYRTRKGKTTRYADRFESSDDYLQFLRPRFEEAYRVLHPHGSFFLHIDYREVHYCKVMLDEIFGRASFMNEIIWAYDYGGRAKSWWPPKHDNILWYAKNPECYTFNFEEMDRIPYMAPGLVGEAKAARGKTPTDVWWHTIVSTSGSEKTGYPTQKPLGVLNRIVKVHSSPDDTLLDFFAGSGTFGEAAALHNRSAILIDNNVPAIKCIMDRLGTYSIELVNADYEVLSAHAIE
ncbi:site-specific DNA-methyltransferase [Candidatus Poribacteria bacterium]|nr:MAG: site-specific DNA-methyltransferase [Candidatus Poribacteria bacterium]